MRRNRMISTRYDIEQGERDGKSVDDLIREATVEAAQLLVAYLRHPESLLPTAMRLEVHRDRHDLRVILFLEYPI